MQLQHDSLRLSICIWWILSTSTKQQHQKHMTSFTLSQQIFQNWTNTNISLLNQMWVEYKATGGWKYPASFIENKVRYWFRTANFLYPTYTSLRVTQSLTAWENNRAANSKRFAGFVIQPFGSNIINKTSALSWYMFSRSDRITACNLVIAESVV